MSDQGWTKSYRRKWKHPIFRNFREAAIWAYLTDNAAWRSDTTFFEGRKIELERGQIAVSERFLAEGFCCDRQVIRRTIGRLQSEQMITRTTTQGITLITICNYGNYQSHEDEEKPPKTQTTTPGRPKLVPNREEDKKGKKEESSLASQAHCALVTEAWNVLCAKGLPFIPANKANDTREKTIRARLKEMGGVDAFTEYLGRFAASTFLRTAGADGGWKPDLDFALRPKTISRVNEGFYDHARPTKAAKPTVDDKARAAHAAIDAVFARPVGAGPPAGLDDPRSAADGIVIDNADAGDLFSRGPGKAGD